MQDINIREVNNSTLLKEVYRRIASGSLDTSSAMSIVGAMLSHADQSLEKQRRKSMDIEVALVAALSKPNRKYGDMTKLEFIKSKLDPYKGKLNAMVEVMVDDMLAKSSKDHP